MKTTTIIFSDEDKIIGALNALPTNKYIPKRVHHITRGLYNITPDGELIYISASYKKELSHLQRFIGQRMDYEALVS